jgi:hypothetical protein
MKIPLRSGRYFSEHDTKDLPHVAIINELWLANYYSPMIPQGSSSFCGIISIPF